MEKNLVAKQRFCNETYLRAKDLLGKAINDIEPEEWARLFKVLEETKVHLNKLIQEKIKSLKMPNVNLDLSIALKLIDKFAGESLELGHFLETVDLLKSYSTDVPDVSIITFLKTRLVGSAHGAIEGATTLEAAKKALTDKFAVKLTPVACEAELKLASQKKMTVTEFGKQVEQLATRLATAHVSNKTFANEAAAEAIVQPAAVNAFINGLNNTQTAFFVRARNPPTLNRAISDALEVLPTNTQEVNWYQPSTSWRPQGYRGRGRNFHSSRGNFRGGYYPRGQHSNNNNNYNYNNNNNSYQSQRGTNRGRGNRGQFRGNNNSNRNNGNNSSRHGNNASHVCNCTHEGQERENNVWRR